MSNKFLIPILTLGVFSILTTEMGVVGMIPLISAKFSVSEGDAGWVVSAFALMVALCAPTLPLLFSGINRKILMLSALGIFTAANVLASLTDSFAMLIAARIFQGALHPLYVAMAFSTAASSVAAADAPKAVGKVFVGVSAGMVLGVSLTSFIADRFGLSAALNFFSAINLLVFVATLFLIPPLPVKHRLSYGSQLGVLRRKSLLIAIFGTLALNAAMFGYFSFFGVYLNSVIGISLSLASAVLFIYGCGSILGNMLSGRLLAGENKSRAKAVRLNLIITPFFIAVLYALLYALGAAKPLVVTAILAVLGVAVGVGQNITQYLVANAAPDAPDFANGLFLSIANLGTVVGTFFCGLVIDAQIYDATRAMLVSVAFLAVSVGFILARNKIAKGAQP